MRLTERSEKREQEIRRLFDSAAKLSAVESRQPAQLRMAEASARCDCGRGGCVVDLPNPIAPRELNDCASRARLVCHCRRGGGRSRARRCGAELTTYFRLSYPAKCRSKKTGKTSFTRFLITLEGFFCIGGTGTKINSNSTGYGGINTRNLCVAFDWLSSPSARAELRRQSNDNILINFGCIVKTVQRIISNC